ncbi:MAG: RNA methyltransferase [Flavobacteriaceae bacterium]|nr:RNA methyltransferase [Flavobacteriaceae bacterium]
MLSKNQIKLINSLKKKKFRLQHDLFLAEGIKVVEEFIQSNFKLNNLFCTNDYLNKFSIEKIQVITKNELKKISEFSTPNQVVGVFEIPNQEKIKIKGLTLVLDDINDPGNLGTIIRLCDWFGVDQLICSTNTVDCYNLKVVQASMGSLSRVSIVYTDIKTFLKEETRPVFGALLQGDNVYQTELEKNSVLIMGSEANGISNEIQKFITNQITIPQFGENQKTESLNVATATAILLSEFKRN